jgi:hypothetical protein
MHPCPQCGSTLPVGSKATLCASCARDDRWDLPEPDAGGFDTQALTESPETLSEQARPPAMGLPGGAESMDRWAGLTPAAGTTDPTKTYGGRSRFRRAQRTQSHSPDTSESGSIEFLSEAPEGGLFTDLFAHPAIQSAMTTLRERLQSKGQSLGAIVDLATLIASADGKIDQSELEILSDALTVFLADNLEPAIVQSFVESSQRSLESSGMPARIRNLARTLWSCGAAEHGLIVAIAVAYASFGLAQPERDLILSLSDATGVPRERLYTLIDTVRSAVDPG